MIFTLIIILLVGMVESLSVQQALNHVQNQVHSKIGSVELKGRKLTPKEEQDVVQFRESFLHIESVSKMLEGNPDSMINVGNIKGKTTIEILEHVRSSISHKEAKEVLQNAIGSFPSK